MFQCLSLIFEWSQPPQFNDDDDDDDGSNSDDDDDDDDPPLSCSWQFKH